MESEGAFYHIDYSGIAGVSRQVADKMIGGLIEQVKKKGGKKKYVLKPVEEKDEHCEEKFKEMEEETLQELGIAVIKDDRRMSCHGKLKP